MFVRIKCIAAQQQSYLLPDKLEFFIFSGNKILLLKMLACKHKQQEEKLKFIRPLHFARARAYVSSGLG